MRNRQRQGRLKLRQHIYLHLQLFLCFRALWEAKDQFPVYQACLVILAVSQVSILWLPVAGSSLP